MGMVILAGSGGGGKGAERRMAARPASSRMRCPLLVRRTRSSTFPSGVMVKLYVALPVRPERLARAG